MLKSERHRSIVEMCNYHGLVSVSFIRKELRVSDMTIRRDLDELAEQRKIVRIRGGAQSADYEKEEGQRDRKELSHLEKMRLHTKEKQYIAKKAAECIDEEDTIFLGSGTTIELMTQHLTNKKIRVVTNSLPVFQLLKEQHTFELYLIGGLYRDKTGAFIGTMAHEVVQKIGIKKAFIGANGLQQHMVSNFSIEEGTLQRIVLDNARKKYLVADANKFDRSDFYNFYDLRQVDALFTDFTLPAGVKRNYQQFTTIIN
ncbi:DeoR/GlpR family DNA-binding transcription regulator [Enterococcus pallens]|uniref:Lactose phosphotransferase system repressor n=1 Tax=Enterococcus pallens ATCC BAA-351 TaxID=1158607 RepID=R2QM32_9ENTE|nr:DeoR/GlpR family DNA-binding transcription regulator [Enterococcus pallens]EOH97627.1 hypothetical protein UAU_00295 [Enterococcus pallens ATCC BAA-351]EOU20954.1 hypothetical protein I588_01801 [Enterococcus pallens ATCC BAA-351]OJG80167.1 hypothetical protein RV10_GL004818 [Enterococcus pallens]